MSDFERGYYCAIAALLREEGCVTSQIKSLFNAGGDFNKADPEDFGII